MVRTPNGRKLLRELYSEIVYEYDLKRKDIVITNMESHADRYDGYKRIDPKKFNYSGFNCPTTDCKGALNLNFMCSLCKTLCCRKCLEKIGTIPDEFIESYLDVSDTMADEDELTLDVINEAESVRKERRKFRSKINHICKPEDVNSMKAIRKDSKPCPVCNTRIQKIEGCNQMFCTNCSSGFDYSTLQQLNTNHFFHNPHYSEFLRTKGIERNNGNACGNRRMRTMSSLMEKYPGLLLHIELIMTVNERVLYMWNPVFPQMFHTTNLKLDSPKDCPYEIDGNTVRKIPRTHDYVHHPMPEPKNNDEDLRIKYIRKEITKANLEKQIKARYLKRLRYEIRIKYMESLLAAVDDIIEAVFSWKLCPTKAWPVIDEIREDYNTSMNAFSKMMKLSFHPIPKFWNGSSYMLTFRDITIKSEDEFNKRIEFERRKIEHENDSSSKS